MSAVRQFGSNVTAVGSGATGFGLFGNANAGYGSTTEGNRQKALRTAGTITRLSANKTAGDRTGMVLRVRKAGANGNGVLTLTSTNGIYEDLTGSDSVTAGQLVNYSLAGGTGGTTSVYVTQTACDWEATGTTTTHMGVETTLAFTASSTVYLQPAGAGNTIGTQVQGEWLVKLPPGVDHVTAKNLFVRTGATAPTNPVTVSLNGATGPGTAPSVSATGANTTTEDTTNSKQIKDGDKISFKIVTGAGTQTTTNVIAIEIQSDDDVSFVVLGGAPGAAPATNAFSVLGGALHASTQSTTESNTQMTVGANAGKRHQLLSVYVKTAGTASGIGLRANAAAAGSPAQVKVATTAGAAWVTDSANTFMPAAPGDLLDWTSAFGSAAATINCVAITVHGKGPNPAPRIVGQAVQRAAVR